MSTHQQIKLSVPALFNDEMIDFYHSINISHKNNDVYIAEVYGSLPKNTARETRRLPVISIKNLIKFAHKLAEIKIDFNYALNSTIIDRNIIEKDIKPLLDILVSEGINTYTVSSTFLLSYLHENYPNINLVLSTIAGSDSIKKVNQAKYFGANRIILDLKTTRNFMFLKNIHQIIDIEYEIMVNEFCGDCLMRNTHYNMQSIGNADMKLNSEIHYPYDICGKMFMSKKSDILKGFWILPEWMKIYKRYGIGWMKITGRTIRDIEWHKKLITSYVSMASPDNIMELAPIILNSKKEEGLLPEYTLQIDNIIKSDYLDHFINKKYDCDNECGITCDYCDKLERKI